MPTADRTTSQTQPDKSQALVVVCVNGRGGGDAPRHWVQEGGKESSVSISSSISEFQEIEKITVTDSETRFTSETPPTHLVML